MSESTTACPMEAANWKYYDRVTYDKVDTTFTIVCTDSTTTSPGSASQTAFNLALFLLIKKLFAIECRHEDEQCSGVECSGYRGKQTTTRTGKTCQRWDSQTPHKHSISAEKYPDAGITDNFCRNPDGEPTIWCYTTNPDERWGYCDPMDCGPTGIN